MHATLRSRAHALREIPTRSAHRPGGILDLTQCRYEQVSRQTTRVSGAVFRPQPYTVKLEGVKPMGFRSMCLGGIKEPILIRQIEVRFCSFDRRLIRRPGWRGSNRRSLR